MADKNYADGYVDVAARCKEFFTKYPDGSLQPVDPAKPFEIIYLDADRADAFTAAYGDRKWAAYQPTMFIVYTAAAYRTPDDPRPGIGVAWEPFPGLTPYTHNSEVMNAETSAWGRAIVAVGAAEAKASAEEVRNRRDEQAEPVSRTTSVAVAKKRLMEATSKPAAAAAWSTCNMPSGNKRVTDAKYAEALDMAIRIESGVEPFGEAADSDEATPEPESGVDTPQEPSDAADGS